VLKINGVTVNTYNYGRQTTGWTSDVYDNDGKHNFFHRNQQRVRLRRTT